MQKILQIKNSKKGFSLPVAIAVTTVLIILSASLIFIAMNSLSKTTSDVNGRQAYLNVRSALEYARAYYNNVSNIDDMDVQCLIVRGDGDSPASGAVAGTVDVVNITTSLEASLSDSVKESRISSAVAGKDTYVVATYNPATVSDPIPTLKLTAYANYSDSTGGKSKTARLSVTYNLGSSGSQNRITVPTIDTGGTPVTYNTQNDTITLNMRQAPGQNWTLAYYIWSFKDRAGVYTDVSTSYDITPSVSQTNTNEDTSAGGQLLTPNGVWVGSGTPDKLGPPSIANSIGNSWYRDQFVPTSTQVNYFNMILSKKGAVLTNGVVDTQTCEMFHLWYIDPSDKNIYFEFLQPHTTYVTSVGWDGAEKLEDTVLVYVNNPKTTVHFKVKGLDDDEVVSTIASTPPRIDSVTVGGSPLSGSSYLNPSKSKAVSNLNMTYEGCGWWVANIETDSTFAMTITYRTSSTGAEVTKTINITPNSSDETWVVVNGDTIQSRTSEDNANKAIGANTSDYVTVHVKPSDTSVDLSKQGSPTLNYLDVEVKSSDGRRALKDKILEVQALIPSDYDDSDNSYTDLTTELNKAIEMYNNDNFISSQAGSTIAEKIAAADTKYNEEIGKLDTAMAKLVPAVCDAETMTELVKLVNEGDKIVDAQTKENVYIGTAYDAFIAAGGAYKTAKDLVNDFNGSGASSITATAVRSSITALENAITEINNNKLDKAALNNLISVAENIANNDRSLYTSETISALDSALSNAKTVYSSATSQTLIDGAKDNLQTAIDNLQLNATVDTSLLESLRTEVSVLLRDEKINCTDESYSALEAEYNSITESQIRAETSQTQVNTWYARLLVARDNFYVYKPDNTNDKLNFENKIRVWLSGFDSVEGFESYTLIEYNKDSDDDNNSRSISNTSSEIVKDIASGLSYIEIDKTLFDRISITVNANNNTYVSEKITVTDIADNNLVVELESLSDSATGGNTENTEEGTGEEEGVTADTFTCNVKQSKLTTVYIEKTTEVPQVKVDTTELTVTSADANYYVVRFISKENQKVSINTKSDGSGTAIPAFAVTSGQWIVQYVSDTSVASPIAVENVYKKYVVSTGSSSKGYTLSNATYVSTDLVSASILSSATEDYAILNTSTTVTRPVDINVADNQIIIWIKTNSESLHLYVWEAVGGSVIEYNGSWPGNQMLKYYESTDMYYVVVPNTAQYLILSDKNGNKLTTGDVPISSGGKTAANNKYWELVQSSGYSLNARSSLPNIVIDYDDVTLGEMSASGLQMALVGGGRVRITNKSYMETYPTGGKKAEKGNTITGTNPFGGDSNGSGRIGDASLATMYDWYEFKIPVDALNTYTFEVKGLNIAEKSIMTKQLSGIYGDVWLTLNSYTKENVNIGGTTESRYSDIDIYTFNPDDIQMEDNVTVYFRMPSGWSNLSVTANGVTDTVTKSLTSGGENGYHYVTLSKKTPFLTFTVTDDSGNIKTYRTSLQGGDSILFDPSSNAESGSWDTFIPIREKLKREIIEAQTLYYGYVIVGKYDDNGYVLDDGASTYKYPEGIMNATINGMRLSDYLDNGSVKTSLVDSMSETNAKSAYNTLHEFVTAYQSLYSTMSTAKSYLPTTLSGSGRYPEYVNRGNKKTYSSASISTLKTKLTSAESTYLSSSTTVSSLNDQSKTLKAAISNVSVESENTITAILYDTQGEVERGSKFTVRYKLHESDVSYVTKDVTDKNPDGFPIIFIEESDIYDVEFLVNGVARGVSKSHMTEDEAWVYFDLAVNPYWTENSTSDYKQINADELTQEVASDKYEYTMRTETVTSGTTTKTEYVPITLYFQYDTTIGLADGTSYLIRAGAYYFSDPNNKNVGGSYPDPESPVRDGVINLYSAESKDYFTNEKNYGRYTEGNPKNAEDISWVTQSGDILSLTTGNKVASFPVNFTANSGSFSSARSYSTTKQMYFRWEGNQSLVVKNNVTFAASELTIASSGTIDASNVYGKHFYLSCTTPGADKMIVTFASDIAITYNDTTGKEHTFTIREGVYECSKADSSQTFIADLFDETYWTSMLYVKLLGRDSTSYGGSGGTLILTNPTYSTD